MKKDVAESLMKAMQRDASKDKLQVKYDGGLVIEGRGKSIKDTRRVVSSYLTLLSTAYESIRAVSEPYE